jgi:N-acylneuraminate cytidylyltransferase
MSEPRILGAVFARGGSKGIPGKNLRQLAGRSLLVHSLDALAAVPRVARIAVSTDDPGISDAARVWGADVIDRPGELATDTAPEWLAWRHFADAIGSDWGDRAGDILLSAPTTSPLRAPADLAAALDRLARDDRVDAVLAVTPAARSPYFNMVALDPDGIANLVLTPPAPIHRRQDAPAVYDVTTVVFAVRARFIRAAERLYDGCVAAIVVPPERAVDIDTEVDFLVAEALLARAAGTRP